MTLLLLKRGSEIVLLGGRGKHLENLTRKRAGDRGEKGLRKVEPLSIRSRSTLDLGSGQGRLAPPLQRFP